MLEPAIKYKDELEKLFANFVYTQEFYLYTGYPGCNEIPNIKLQDDYYQYAVVSNTKRSISSIPKVTGYFAYHIDPGTDTVENFGLFSFKENNLVLAKDVYTKMTELIKTHRRIEWRVIGGNSVIRSYDRLCKSFDGNKVTLHSVCKDPQGNWRDMSIYEIVNY